MKFLTSILGSFIGTLCALALFSAVLYSAFQAYQPEIIAYVSDKLSGPIGDAIQSKVASSLPSFG